MRRRWLAIAFAASTATACTTQDTRPPSAGSTPVLVAAQITLGIVTVLTMRSVPVAVGHFAGAAALWALWISAWFVTAPLRTATVAGQEPRVDVEPREVAKV